MTNAAIKNMTEHDRILLAGLANTCGTTGGPALDVNNVAYLTDEGVCATFAAADSIVSDARMADVCALADAYAAAKCPTTGSPYLVDAATVPAVAAVYDARPVDGRDGPPVGAMYRPIINTDDDGRIEIEMSPHGDSYVVSFAPVGDGTYACCNGRVARVLDVQAAVLQQQIADVMSAAIRASNTALAVLKIADVHDETIAEINELTLAAIKAGAARFVSAE